ncbi:hypothetical protein, partial [Chlamydia suis]|uniref:hypothetical protein n=1 Tax=Chlamydia suis TaxID=83559 RepID=UPI001CA53BC1
QRVLRHLITIIYLPIQAIPANPYFGQKLPLRTVVLTFSVEQKRKASIPLSRLLALKRKRVK